MEFEKLKKIIAEVLNVDPDEITMETTFQDDLGADSLDVYQIIMGIEEEFDIEIPAESAEQKPDVSEEPKDPKIDSVLRTVVGNGTPDIDACFIQRIGHGLQGSFFILSINR